MDTTPRPGGAQEKPKRNPLLRAGPQSFNRIAGTFREQLARATKPRNPPAVFLVTRGQLHRVVAKRVRAVSGDVAVLVTRIDVLEARLAAGGAV